MKNNFFNKVLLNLKLLSQIGKLRMYKMKIYTSESLVIFPSLLLLRAKK